MLDDRVQYSDVLPQKTHVTSVLYEEPMPPPLPNKRVLCYIKRSIYPLHMWQSWVDIEYYSVVYFNHVTTFEAL